jgi:NAD(P)-dependent dehydrogenase (short-subunit alcohol dehydrogenase family)
VTAAPGWIDLTGRVAVVTGAGGGIGAGIAQALSAVGATVVLLDRNAAAAEAMAATIRAAGGQADAVACDVSDGDDVTRAAAQSQALRGPCDILVNNAGFQSPGQMERLPAADWNAVLAVNLTGYFLCAQAFGAQMLPRRTGAVVHIASISGSSPQGYSGAYSVSKAGVIMLSQQLATEWGPSGVRSNVVSPGLIRTPMTREFYDTPGVLAARQALVPLRRIGAPDDIANAVVFLVSDRASYVTGTEITVDGGFTRTIMNVIPRPGFDAAAPG